MLVQMVEVLLVESTQLGETGLRKNHLCILNVLEIVAAYFAVKIYAATLTETSVYSRVDNTAIFAWINKQTAPNVTVHLLLKEF